MDVKKRKTIVIASLTILAILITGLFQLVCLVWFPEDVAGPDPVRYVVSLMAFPCILTCSIGIFITMHRWSVRWFIKAGIVLLLVLLLLIPGFVWGIIICFPAI